MNTPATEHLPGAVGSRPLPRGWRSVRLSDVCEESIPTRDPRDSPSDSFRYVDITSVSNVSKRIVSPKTVLGKDAPSRARQVIRTGDVLVATTRPNLNAVALVPTELDGEIASTGFCVLRAKSGLNPRYLFGFVQTGKTVRNLSELVKGALYPAVTDAQVRAQWLPLPELSEQQRIVDVLAEQMVGVKRARVAAEAQLEAAKALPATYLRDVFCGAEAKRWPRVPLGNVGEIVSGITLGRRLPEEKLRTVAYLRVANVKDAYLDLSDVYTIEATDTEIERLRLRDGDLLLTEGGDPDKLGRGACWRGEIAECIHQNHIFRVRFDPKQVLPGFVSAQVASQHGKAYFLANAKQTTGIATINQRVLAAFPLMLPGLEVQGRVVATLSDCVERAGRARKQAEEQMAAINALPASLLRRAFSGDL